MLKDAFRMVLTLDVDVWLGYQVPNSKCLKVFGLSNFNYTYVTLLTIIPAGVLVLISRPDLFRLTMSHIYWA